MALKVDLTVNDSSFKAKMQEAINSFKKMATAITGAKNAQQALNNMIKANPWGLVTTVAIAATEAIYKYATGVYEAERAQAEWAREIENTSNQLDQMKNDADFDIAIAKAAGKSSEELAKLRVEAAKARLAIADLNFDRVLSAYMDGNATKEQVDEMRNLQKAAEDALNAANRARTILDVQKRNGTGEFKPKKTRAVKADNSEERRIQKMMDDLRKEEREAAKIITEARAKEHQTETIGLSGFNQKTMAAWMSGRQNDLAGAEFGSVDYNTIMQNIADMQAIKTIMEERLKAGLQATDAEGVMESYWERVFDGENIQDSTWQSLIDAINEHLKEIGQNPIELDFTTGKASKSNKDKKSENGLEQLNKFNGDYSKVVGGVSSIASGIQKMGVEIPKELQSVVSTLSGISTIISGITSILSLILVAQNTNNTVSLIDALVPFARGGIVPHAQNGLAVVPGNHYSGDVTPILANAGEVVLNHSQVQTLASNLQGQNGGGINIIGELQGEKIVLVANRFLKRSGQGELVTW